MLTGLVAIALIYLLPMRTSTVTMLTTVGIYSIVAMGFNVLLGFSGQISLGHAAFMGLGAYVSAFVTQNMGLPFEIALLASGIIPIGLGLVLGLVALRLEGHYLAIATMGFGVAIQQTFKVLTGFTNGFAGKTAPSASVFGFTIKGGPSYFILVTVVVVILAIMIHNLAKSKTGRALVAMRDSEHAASAMGINVLKYKLIAFSISAFYAGIAGSLYMHLVKYTQPDVWGTVLSINLLAMVVIGGLGSVGGSILGAAIIVMMPQLVHEIPVVNHIASSATILTGLVIILIIKFMPQGIMSLSGKWKRLLPKNWGGN